MNSVLAEISSLSISTEKTMSIALKWSINTEYYFEIESNTLNECILGVNLHCVDFLLFHIRKCSLENCLQKDSYNDHFLNLD